MPAPTEPDKPTSEAILIVEKHPRPIRWFHWLHFPLISVMVWSGLLIYWANDQYGISLSGPVAETLHLDHRLAEGMGWHFFLMWLFALNGVAYAGYLLYTGEWRELVPDRLSFREAVEVTLHDLHLRKQPPARRGKFNGAQRIAYSLIILMGFLALVTGLAIYKPVQAGWLTSMLGGYEIARREHFVLMLGFVGFFVVHIAQVIRAGWNNFRAMVTGYEIETVKTRE